MYHSTETAQLADLVLPAAGWGEKDGTFINSERRIGLVKKVRKAPGQALSDFNIFKLISQFWGCSDLFKSWKSPEAVFRLLRDLTVDQPCDITAVTGYGMLEGNGGIQWPCADRSDLTSNQRRLFEDGQFYHANKKARFIFEKPKPLAEPLNNAFPFQLLTGRGTSSQWHTQTRTGKSAVLRKLYPSECYVEISMVDAAQYGIEPNDKVLVVSKRGKVEATAFVVNTVQVGQLFMPMHYAKANQLTHASFDPYSRQPSYKASAVNIELLTT